MLIFSVDTSSRQGSMALATASADSFAVLEVVPLAGGTYSASLIPQLAALLLRHERQKHELEAFTVVSGPGSFTGLRVGLSTVKALAEVMHRPIAAISMLEAVAAQCSHAGLVIAALDAGRKEVYAGEYEGRRGGSDKPNPARESLRSQAQLLAWLESNPGAELITPDEAISSLAARHLRVKQIDWPDAGAIARLGFDKIQAGDVVAPEVLEANYIRRSDAEIFS
jgi:tRNA threonylcarbamoyladenosine biosynthesis protein TsaB